MSTTVLRDALITQCETTSSTRILSIAMTFWDDPMMGMTCDRFTGSATAKLSTKSFVLRTAALR